MGLFLTASQLTNLETEIIEPDESTNEFEKQEGIEYVANATEMQN